MATNSLRELAALSHDIRKIGWKKIPKNMERACVIFINTKSHLNSQSPKAAVKFAKLAKYMECEVFVINNPTVNEYIDAMRYFLTDVSDFLACYAICNKLDSKLPTKPAEIPLADGVVDPDLFYDMLNSKKPESKVFFAIDAINNPKDWDPAANGANRPGIYVMAPYADTSNPEIEQFDHSQESIFNLELNKVVKSMPDGTLGDIANTLEEIILPFGNKVYAAAYPASLVRDGPCFV